MLYEVIWKFKSITNDVWNTTLIFGKNEKVAIADFVVPFKSERIIIKKIEKVE